MVSQRSHASRARNANATPFAKPRRNAVSVAVAASLTGFAAFPAPSVAQETQEGSGEVIEEVVAYGQYRRSLVDAITTKRDSTTIVEALSAEDIGKLPDSSIAESLSRMPGLSGARVNGRVSGISVRGFKEDFVGSMLNGRELLGIGDNRGVEYDLYPSEIISGIVVYKSADASLFTQGVGGTVDLRTTRPLDRPPVLAFTGTYEQNDLESGNPDFDDNGHRLALNFSDIYMDDRLGLALTLATTESPSQEEQFRGWGYPTIDPANAAPGVNLTGDETVLGGHDSFVRSAVLERDTAAGVIQFEPTEDLTFTLDGLYIDFQEDKVFRGIEEGGAVWGTGDYTVTGAESGFVTSADIDGGFLSVIRNDGESKVGELSTGGLNIEWNVNENWVLSFDGAYGDVRKTITNIESYAGVGRAGLATQGGPTVRSFQMTPTGAMYMDTPGAPTTDLADFDLVRLAGPQSWGGALSPVPRWEATPAFPNIGAAQAQDGFVNEPRFDEQLTTLRLDAESLLDLGPFNNVEFGVMYADRIKSKDNRGFFLTAPTWPQDGPVPEEARVGTADLSFIGVPGVVAYDGLGLFRSGFYELTDAALLETARQGDSYTVDEEVTTYYGKLEFAADVGNMYLSGNFGLQIVDTEQQSFGFISQSGPDGFVDALPVSGGDSYTDVLPSLNLNLEISESQLLRFAASTTISRPRMDDMRPNQQVSFAFNENNLLSTDPEFGPWSGSAGNPTLKPLESDNLDLSYEWYFADDGFLAVAWFYKDLVNWHRQGEFVADFSEFFIPGFHQVVDGGGNVITPATFDGIVTFREDGLTGFVRGYEVQGLLPLGAAWEPLEGLGIVASASFNDGSLDDGTRVPGLSDENYSLTLFYERGGFAARIAGTKRSKFLTEARGLSLSLVDQTDQGAELVDAQISYDFGLGGFERLDGLFIALQGQNLTDEDTVLTNDDSREVLQFQSFGANYLFTAIYRFE